MQLVKKFVKVTLKALPNEVRQGYNKVIEKPMTIKS